jgi:hypothetical protein
MMQAIPAGACRAADRLEAWEATTLPENKTAVIYGAPGAGVTPAQFQAIPEQGALLKRLPTPTEVADADLSAGATTELKSSS